MGIIEEGQVTEVTLGLKLLGEGCIDCEGGDSLGDMPV